MVRCWYFARSVSNEVNVEQENGENAVDKSSTNKEAAADLTGAELEWEIKEIEWDWDFCLPWRRVTKSLWINTAVCFSLYHTYNNLNTMYYVILDTDYNYCVTTNFLPNNISFSTSTFLISDWYGFDPQEDFTFTCSLHTGKLASRQL